MISLKSVFWHATPCSIIKLYRIFGGTCCAIFRAEVFYPEDGGGIFLRNIDDFLPDYMASNPS
jgi:hypothetical protein